MKLNYSSVFVWNLIVSPQIITIYTVYMILPISSLSFSKWQSIGWFCYTEKYSQIPQLSSNTVCSTSLPHSLPHKKGIVILLFFNAHLKAFKFSIFNCLVPKLTENFSHHTSYECSLIGNDKLHTEWDSCYKEQSDHIPIILKCHQFVFFSSTILLKVKLLTLFHTNIPPRDLRSYFILTNTQYFECLTYYVKENQSFTNGI